MCQVMEDTHEEGREEGFAIGHEEGRAEGIEEGKVSAIIDLYVSGDISREKAIEKIGIEPDLFDKAVLKHNSFPKD